MVLLTVPTMQKGGAVPSGTKCEEKPQEVPNMGEEHEMGSESPVGPKKGGCTKQVRDEVSQIRLTDGCLSTSL